MKSYVVSAALLLSLLSVFWTCPEKNKLRIATYNIRRQGEDPEAYRWENREKKVVGLIETINPDIIGFQEPIKGQINDLEKLMPCYGWVGQERSAGIQGWSLWHRMVMLKATDEFNPIFYNKNRITVLESGTFGIDSGRIVPQHFKDLPRICTWALCEDKHMGKKFYVYNTHLDHKKDGIRLHQITRILEDIKNRVKDNSLCILMGDFNTDVSTGGMQEKLSAAGFDLARVGSHTIKGPRETRTGWNDDELKAIDYILIAHKAKNEKVSHYEVVESPKGAYPSDHRPVVADIMVAK